MLRSSLFLPAILNSRTHGVTKHLSAKRSTNARLPRTTLSQRAHARQSKPKLHLAKIYAYIFGRESNLNTMVEERMRLATTQEAKEKIQLYRANIIENKQREINTFFAEYVADSHKRHFQIILDWLRSQALQPDTAQINIPSTCTNFLLPNEQDAKTVYSVLNQEYRFFSGDDNFFQVYLSYLKVVKLYLDFFEIDRDSPKSHHKKIYSYAYTLMVLFDETSVEIGLRKVDRYIQQFLDAQTWPMRVLMNITLPKNSLKNPIPLLAWRELIMLHGSQATQFFRYAGVIAASMPHQKLETIDQVFRALAKNKYSRYRECPELAVLFAQYQLDNVLYEKCLHLYLNRKKYDLLPDVTVNGAEHGLPGYYLTKLPLADVHAFVLGHETDCCLSYGDMGEACVVSGMTIPSVGFYVLLRKRQMKQSDDLPLYINNEINYSHYQIVGQSYAWLSQAGNLVIDSWENKDKGDDAVVVKLLPIMAAEIMATSSMISRVVIGRGSRTPDFWKRQLATLSPPEQIAAGYQHDDSSIQTLICASVERLNLYKQKISEKIAEMNLHRQALIDFIADNRLHSVKQQRAVSVLLSFPVVTKWLSGSDFCIATGKVAGFDVSFVFRYFSAAQKEIFFRVATPEHWRDMLWNSEILGRTLSMLTPSEQKKLWHTLGHSHIQTLCFTLTDVELIVRYLHADLIWDCLTTFDPGFLSTQLVDGNEFCGFLSCVPERWLVPIFQLFGMEAVQRYYQDISGCQKFLQQIPAHLRLRLMIEMTDIWLDPKIGSGVLSLVENLLPVQDVPLFQAHIDTVLRATQRGPRL